MKGALGLRKFRLKCSFSDPRADQVSQGFAEKRRQRARRLIQDAFLDEDWLGDQGVAFKKEVGREMTEGD